MYHFQVELDKAPWMDPVVIPSSIKIPNGMLPVPQNKQMYLAGELQSLRLDGESALQRFRASSSSESSNSSECQSPPDTPTEPAIAPHGPGRGKPLQQQQQPPAPPQPPISHEQPLYAAAPNCPVPYAAAAAGQFAVPATFHNRSLIYSRAPYRAQPQFAPGEVLYPFAPFPYLPVPLSSNAPAPPAKATCYNCGLGGHAGPDCKDCTIEEITQKRGYQLEWRTPPPEVVQQQQQPGRGGEHQASQLQ